MHQIIPVHIAHVTHPDEAENRIVLTQTVNLVVSKIWRTSSEVRCLRERSTEGVDELSVATNEFRGEIGSKLVDVRKLD